MADQPALLVDDVAGVDGLLVDARAADVVHRLAHGEVVAQVDVFDGHQRARAVLRVVEELVDQLARALVRVLQHLLDDVGRHFLQEVDRIIQEHVVHQRLELGVGGALGDELLLVAVHVGEHVGGDVLGQHAEELDHPRVLFNLLQALGDIHRQAVRRLFLKIEQLARVHQGNQLFKILAEFLVHRDSLLSFSFL